MDSGVGACVDGSTARRSDTASSEGLEGECEKVENEPMNEGISRVHPKGFAVDFFLGKGTLRFGRIRPRRKFRVWIVWYW